MKKDIVVKLHEKLAEFERDDCAGEMAILVEAAAVIEELRRHVIQPLPPESERADA